MLKIIFTLTVIYIFTLWNVNAFLWQWSWLNLYNDIEKWIDDLTLKNFKYEISWWWKSISKEINKNLKNTGRPECIKDWLSIEDYKLITQWDITALVKNLKITKECFYEWEIDIKNLNELISTIKLIDITYRQKADNISDDIYKISSIGIYSDWDLNNSSFDLINDIEDIDKIIFTKEIPYNWEEISNTDKNFSNFLKWNLNLNLNKKPNINTNNIINTNNNTNANANTSWNSIVNPYISPLLTSTNNNYVCPTNNQNNWLSESTLNSLLPNIYSWNLINKWNNTNKLPLLPINKLNKNTLPIKQWKINKILANIPFTQTNNNSSFWPCSTFFCINIDFKIHSQKLFAWWNSFSIENYMNITNWHLKKFAWTDLSQAKMTVNNFQLWLKNLKLSDIFHIGIILTARTPPIIKDNKRENDEYLKRLKEYYKNHYDWNYDRRNSLIIYNWEENEYKSLSDSANLSIIKVKQRDKSLKDRQALENKQNKLVKSEFDHKILSEDMDIFYEKFIPIESFTKNILNYANNANIDIMWINEKPSN